MIDYLEKIFAPGADQDRPSVTRGAELPRMGEVTPEEGRKAALPPVAAEGGKLPDMPVLFRGTGRSPALTVPDVEVGEGASFPRFRVNSGEREGDPVRKLRRDSRRYDSGFYWY